jgi:hypothetical protein
MGKRPKGLIRRAEEEEEEEEEEAEDVYCVKFKIFYDFLAPRQHP